MTSKVVAIIPARWGSKRFPGKPLHRIAGKPLIQHVWERCISARMLDKVIIATDDKRILKAAIAFGAEVVLTSSAHPSGTDRIAEVAREIFGISHVINIQGDEPLINPRLIDQLVKKLISDRNIEMITVASIFEKSTHAANPNSVKVVLDKYLNALYFSRSIIPFIRSNNSGMRYYRHQGIYGYSRKLLLQFVKWKPGILEKTEQLEQLRALENGVKIHVLITKYASMGVDVPEDVQIVTALLKKK